MAASHFNHELEVDLVSGHNIAAVDLKMEVFPVNKESRIRQGRNEIHFFSQSRAVGTFEANQA